MVIVLLIQNLKEHLIRLLRYKAKEHIRMDIKKKQLNDIVELGNTKWKVIKTYTTDNPELFYKDRITMINLETGETMDCANSFS